MTRESRERKTAPGVVSHVIARGNNRMSIFRTAADLYWFCDRLRALKAEFGVELYTFCLMSNHFHLLIRQAEKTLGAFMQALQTAFAVRFNALYGHSGHVFQDRYFSKPCLDDRYFMTLLQYIGNNPVAAGMVKDAWDWKFSGHRELLGDPGLRLVDTTFPLALFDEDLATARLAYADLVRRRTPTPHWQGRMLEIFAKEGFTLDEMRGRRRGLATDVRYEAILAGLDCGAKGSEIARFLQADRSLITRAKSLRAPEVGFGVGQLRPMPLQA